jgi:tRNA(Ile)-lysidine synthase
VLEQLLLHIERHQLCKTTDKILLAVSGGVDSMVMLHLFKNAGFNVGVAHCNFQLRKDESDADEKLVERTCAASEIPYFVTRLETKLFAKENGLSTQLAARQLRYHFFETIAVQHGYDYIATAHHLNDSIETVFLNLTRGTGIDGLAGIRAKNERIIRPLLFATRETIEAYAVKNKIEWREDKSNSEDDYQRNFIRHKITPLLRELNPNLDTTFSKNLERFAGAIEMTRSFLNAFKNKSLEQKDGDEWIQSSDVKGHAYPEVLLWELLKSKGFNYEQCCEAVQNHQSGKQFLSGTHRLFIDRHHFIVSELKQEKILDVLVPSYDQRVSNGCDELIVKRGEHASLSIDRNPMTAVLDSSMIAFPLRWRPWRPGDFFQPLGMDSNKKVSDFLIDAKVPSSQKAKVTVIESAGKIIWVVGMRPSDHVKITPATTASMVISVRKVDREKIL